MQKFTTYDFKIVNLATNLPDLNFTVGKIAHLVGRLGAWVNSYFSRAPSVSFIQLHGT